MIAILIQVTLKSQRLPNKALLDLDGKPLIVQLTRRVEESGLHAIWCIRNNAQDDPLEELARIHGAGYYRGAHDAMTRLVDCAEEFGLKTIVRVTGDNPMTDPRAIAYMVTARKLWRANYVWTQSIPRGTRPEVIQIKALSDIRDTYPIEDTEQDFTPLMRLLPKARQIWLPWGEMDRAAVVASTSTPEASYTVDTQEDLDRVRGAWRGI